MVQELSIFLLHTRVGSSGPGGGRVRRGCPRTHLRVGALCLATRPWAPGRGEPGTRGPEFRVKAEPHSTFPKRLSVVMW